MKTPKTRVVITSPDSLIKLEKDFRARSIECTIEIFDKDLEIYMIEAWFSQPQAEDFRFSIAANAHFGQDLTVRYDQAMRIAG